MYGTIQSISSQYKKVTYHNKIALCNCHKKKKILTKICMNNTHVSVVKHQNAKPDTPPLKIRFEDHKTSKIKSGTAK